MTTDNNEIRTVDAVAIVMRNLQQQLATYPANSVSRREVVVSIFPKTDVYEDVNALVTAIIVKESNNTITKNNGKALNVVSKQWLEELTQTIRQAIEDLV